MSFDGVMGFIQSGLVQWQQLQDIHGAAPAHGAQGSTPPPAPRDSQSSTVSSGGAPPPPPPGPNQDVRAQSQGSASGYSDSQAKALRELEENPAYILLNDQLKDAQSLMTSAAFTDLEAKWGNGGPDGLLSWGNIEWAVQFGDRGTSRAALELANYLHGHEDVFKAIDKSGDGLISQSEINTYIQGLKQNIYDRKKEALKSAGPDSSGGGVGGASPGSSGGSQPGGGTTGTGTGGTGGTDNTRADAPLPEFTPFRSDKTDPFERTADAIGHWQNEIDKLSKQIAQERDPGRLAALQAQMSKASNVLQSMMSLMQQLQTMLSNVAKMWSDMAMTAIRNTH